MHGHEDEHGPHLPISVGPTPICESESDVQYDPLL